MHLGPLYSLTENGIHYHHHCLPGPALMVLLCAVSLEASAPCPETQPSVLSSKPALPPVLSRGNAPSSRVIFPAQPGGARKL